MESATLTIQCNNKRRHYHYIYIPSGIHKASGILGPRHGPNVCELYDLQFLLAFRLSHSGLARVTLVARHIARAQRINDHVVEHQAEGNKGLHDRGRT